MNELIIDKEFHDLIPPLTKEEYAGLEISIIKEGCRDALIVWNDIIIDGHNRYEICQRHNMPFNTVERVFNSRDDVIDWIINNQLSRRNLTPENQSYLRGLQYQREKKKTVNNLQKTKTDIPKHQNEVLANTAERLAEQHNVSKATIERDAEYAKAVDTIVENTSPEIKQQILNREINVTKKDIETISEFEPEKQKDIIDKIIEGKAKSIYAIIKNIKKQESIKNRLPNIKDNPDIQLFNNDCIEILQELPDESIDMVLTDPPYGVKFNPSWSTEKWSEKQNYNATICLLDNACNELMRICKKNAHIYIFTGWVNYPEFSEIISEYFDISNLIVWEKNNTSLVDFDKRYASKHEFIVFAKQQGNNERVLNNKQSPDILHFDRVNNPEHSCEKPIKLLEYLILNSTVENETVFDCFMGMGNTGVASIKNKRKFIGIEIEKEIFDIAKIKINEVSCE